MEIKDIYEIWDKFEKSSVSEMKLSLDGASLELKKEPEAVRRKKTEYEALDAVKEENESETKEKSGYTKVKAPLVGTFYRASSPEVKPFTEAGMTVKKGDILGIIEAMKIMNDITAPVSGKVVEIRAEDGKLIEYGQTLFILEEENV